MKKALFTLAALAVILVGTAVPAHAWNFPKKWPAGVNRDYCIEPDVQNQMGGPSYTNFKQSVFYGIEDQYEDRTDLTTNFQIVSGVECAANYTFTSFEGCADILEFENNFGVTFTSRVSFDNMTNNANGETLKCDRDGNGNLDFFWVNIDCCYQPWHFAHDDDVPNGDYSFAGIFVHEFGHALGFTGHYGESDPECPDGSNYQTMCVGEWQGAFVGGYGGANGKALQTLGTNYDIPDFNSIYP